MKKFKVTYEDRIVFKHYTVEVEADGPKEAVDKVMGPLASHYRFKSCESTMITTEVPNAQETSSPQ